MELLGRCPKIGIDKSLLTKSTGWPKVMANFKVTKKDGKKIATDTGACLAGLRWEWSGDHKKLMCAPQKHSRNRNRNRKL